MYKSFVAAAAMAVAVSASASTTPFSFTQQVTQSPATVDLYTWTVGNPTGGTLTGTVFGKTNNANVSFQSLYLDGVAITGVSVGNAGWMKFSLTNYAIGAGSHTFSAVYDGAGTGGTGTALGSFSFTTSPVPEPASAALLLAGLAAMGGLARRRKLPA